VGDKGPTCAPSIKRNALFLWQKECQTSQEQLLIREKGKVSRGGLVRVGGDFEDFGLNIRLMGTQAASGSIIKGCGPSINSMEQSALFFRIHTDVNAIDLCDPHCTLGSLHR
jgi:hypothetical protein